MGLSSLLGGALPFVGSSALAVGSSLIGAWGQREANEDTHAANLSSAREQMAFQEKMVGRQEAFQEASVGKQMAFQERLAGSAHQREVADLRAAGLNPILSGTGGMGSITPAGASASGASAPGASSGYVAQNELADITGSALAVRRNIEEVKNMQETNANIRADTRLKDEQRQTQSSIWNLTQEQARLTQNQNETEQQRTRTERAEADIRASNAKGRELEGQIDETRYGEIMRYINRFMDALTGGASAFRNLQPRPDVIIRR